MKIYLVGMPGSGKSTLGKQLAQKLQVNFVDLDVEIERTAQKSVTEIFVHHGEDYFRQIESDHLKKWAHINENFVMATGGGAPCFQDGMKIINDSGLSIFLDVPVNELLSRLGDKHDRPLLGKELNEREKKLKEIATERLACYRKAKIRLESPTLDDLLTAIHSQK